MHQPIRRRHCEQQSCAAVQSVMLWAKCSASSRGSRLPRSFAARNDARRAFTLIELSIVLVIIGLIVGGVLVGQDLIQGAKNRAILSELSQYEVMYNTFRLKYNGFAGDLKNASTFGLGDDGDGNKVVGRTRQGGCPGGSYYLYTQSTTPPEGCGGPSVSANGEAHNFWLHMKNAGLIDANITPYSAVLAEDQMPFKNGIGDTYLQVFSWAGKTYVQTGLAALNGGVQSRFTIPSVKGRSVTSIQSKLGYKYINHDSPCVNNFTGCSYPDALAAGQRIIGSSASSAFSGAGTLVYSTTSNPDKACLSASGYIEDGDCHIIWQIN